MRLKIMIIGPRQSGKTTLANVIEDKVNELKATSDIRYGEYTIDMPSGYLESPWMYDCLIASNQDASVVFFLVDPLQQKQEYPPSFSKSFHGTICGIITKCDLANEAQIQKAYDTLQWIGITEPVIEWSSKTEQGKEDILAYKEFCKLLY
ncbi:EutP/PduV family microcompartment system protein [uncultured Veillonella sp.]|uniref:EutP/PduV family microcompartment system protein n=1 Tax=uncultured Veillonella sp. TaxID=159268 RepID=UPI0025D70CF7|nr:EutP/PduV family microcompartment system protein [uncultured Veillonella sp.]MDY3973869.1 EutP/PduV family microcompartment system protein [Veillonella caviae]